MLILGIIALIVALFCIIMVLCSIIKCREVSTEEGFGIFGGIFFGIIATYFLVTALSVHSYTMISCTEKHSYNYNSTIYIVEGEDEVVLLRDDNKIVRLNLLHNIEDFEYQVGDSFECNGNQLDKWGSYTIDKVIKKDIK